MCIAMHVYITLLQYKSQYITTYYNILQEHGPTITTRLRDELAKFIIMSHALSIVLKLRSRWKYWSLPIRECQKVFR